MISYQSAEIKEIKPKSKEYVEVVMYKTIFKRLKKRFIPNEV